MSRCRSTILGAVSPAQPPRETDVDTEVGAIVELDDVFDQAHLQNRAWPKFSLVSQRDLVRSLGERAEVLDDTLGREELDQEGLGQEDV